MTEGRAIYIPPPHKDIEKDFSMMNTKDQSIGKRGKDIGGREKSTFLGNNCQPNSHKPHGYQPAEVGAPDV